MKPDTLLQSRSGEDCTIEVPEVLGMYMAARSLKFLQFEADVPSFHG
jgi:hypothetical protein